MLTFGSLFSGVGGMDLGFHQAGMECRWQVEIEPYARRVLTKHWPTVRRHDDVRTWPQPDSERVDVICGGPPCQPSSHSGLRLGESDHRWMWPDTLRIIREMVPRFVVLENPPALLTLDGGRAFGRILGALADCGIDAEWDVLPAGAFGLPHFRERLFVVANANGKGRTRILGNLKTECSAPFWKKGGIVRKQSALEPYRRVIERVGYDLRRPGVSGTSDGVPCRVDRLQGIGNAVAPPVAKWIAEQIINSTKETR